MPKTLLVVDESRTIRESARLALAGEDWAIVEASSRTEALQELRMSFPDAILCDADLAGEDNFSLCREIRGTPQGRETPIVLMGNRVDGAAAGKVGVRQTLPKPFASPELAEALQSAIELQDLSQELAHGSVEDDLSPALPSPAGGGGEDDAEVVEIIDLSGDEDFEELELVEDLEPVEVIEAAPSEAPFWDQKGWEESPADTPSPSLPEEPITLEDDGLDFSALEPEPSSHSVLEVSEPTFSPAPAERIELPEDLGFGLVPPPALEAQAVEFAAPLEETPYSYEPAPLSPELEPLGFTEPASIPSEAPFRLHETEGLAATVAATTENAVREALSHSLSAEALSPLVAKIVERVVWEVVPQLAERLILEAIEKLKTPPPD